MMIPVSFDITHNDEFIIAADNIAAEVDVFRDGTWDITGFSIDKGQYTYVPIHNQAILDFLYAMEDEFKETIEYEVAFVDWSAA